MFLLPLVNHNDVDFFLIMNPISVATLGVKDIVFVTRIVFGNFAHGINYDATFRLLKLQIADSYM